jgi:putative glutamate/gamma-aminobutyrate antiporter
MLEATPQLKRVISVFTLVMINVIAIDSLRNVPAAAEYGFSLIFYYGLAALIFFIPASLVAAELATGWPENGGIYVWVRAAFGPRVGFLAIWLQWIENVIWYPTMMSFIAATFLYAINPDIASNKGYLLAMMLSLFWLATIINMMGMRISGIVSVITALFGTLLPMMFIVILGIDWVASDHPRQIQFTVAQFLPDLTKLDNLAFLTAVLLSLVGVELSATHAQEVKHPQRDYPRAMIVSVLIIITSLVLSSLAIALVVPKEKINLVNGLIQAFAAFFEAYHLPQLTAIIAMLIVVGGFGGVAAWIIGPSKGLLIATHDHVIPHPLKKINQAGVPVGLLILQGIIFTVLCSLFLYFPSINSSYWVLTALTTQLYMLMYFIMFLSALRLRYTQPEVIRSYRVPGGYKGMWITASLGMIGSLITLLIGFVPPAKFDFGGTIKYELILVVGFIIFCIPPLLVKVTPQAKSDHGIGQATGDINMISMQDDLRKYRTLGIPVLQLMGLIAVGGMVLTLIYKFFFG